MVFCRTVTASLVAIAMVTHQDGASESLFYLEELLRNARSNEMISRFVMLNCMNEFKYAQQALEYGASGYILKLSMSMQSMQDILAKVAKELTAANEQRQQVLSQKFNVFYKQILDQIKADRLEEEALPGEFTEYETESGLSQQITVLKGVTVANPVQLPAVLSLADSLQLPLAGFNRVFLLSLIGNYSLTPEELLKQNMIEAKLGMWTGSFTSSSSKCK